MNSENLTKDRRYSEPYSPLESTIWHDPMEDSTPAGGSSVTLLPLADQYEVFSNFGEEDCGEPFKSQHIVLDFTPDSEIDNVDNQKKCCDFWDYVNKIPQVRHMCVYPISPPVDVTPRVVQVEGPPPIPAVNVIKDPLNKYIEVALNTKMPQSKCSLGADSYQEEDPTIRKESSPDKSLPISICKCKGICSKCHKTRPKPTSSPGKVQSKKLHKIFEDWDKKHPKSMEPPGAVMQHVPILQRVPPPDQDPKTCFD